MSAGQGAGQGLTRRELFGWLRARPAEAPESPAAAASVATSLSSAAASPSPAPPSHAAPAPAAPAASRLASVSAAAIGARLPPMLVPAVLEHACLATTSMCSVCVERCPRPGAIAVSNGRPRVVEAACDGCGRCLAVCPAPTMAFTLVPRTSPRPTPGVAP